MHEQCKARPEAVIWGIDWSKRRKSRKRGRENRKRTKSAGMKTCGVAAVKPTVEVTEGTARGVVMPETCAQEREPYAWLGADFVSYLKEAEEERMASEVPLTVSKRLQRNAKATETVHAVARGSMQSLELKEVAAEIGVSAKMETSVGGCFQEIAGLKECERGPRNHRGVKLLEEAALRGEESIQDPATRRTSPER